MRVSSLGSEVIVAVLEMLGCKMGLYCRDLFPQRAMKVEQGLAIAGRQIRIRWQNGEPSFWIMQSGSGSWIWIQNPESAFGIQHPDPDPGSAIHNP
jgi:hypothetical protein